jgi:hypothetical protein
MPIETRPSDTFTKDNLLIGFSVVEFTPTATGVPVQVGILSGEELQKEVETLQLQRGDSGTLTVDRELISSIEVTMQLEVFNFRADIAELIFGSTTGTPVTADAAAANNDNIKIPLTNAFDSFVGLTRGEITESSVEVTFQTITSEAVGTGDGASGGTQGDYSLDQKIKAIGDLTTSGSLFVGGVDETANVVAGSTPAAGEIAIEVGEEDSTTTGSGAITFGASKIPANGAAIVATYTPSFSTTAGDIVNGGLPASLDNDFVFDPIQGKIRFLHEGADDSPFRLTGAEAPLNVAYTYNQRSATNLKPFTQTQVDGSCTIKHLTDIGVNFIWTIPSATILITDDALTFGAEEFGTATLALNVNDAGGSDRFGTLELASETQANA